MKSLLLLLLLACTLTLAKVPCGFTAVKGTNIIGGHYTKKDAWPWQVGILYNGIFICGGSIITPSWIVTAAHCIEQFQTEYLKIVVGDHNLEDRDGDEQWKYVRKAFYHPDWNKPTELNNDIALIQTDTPMKFNQHVRPICLPKPNEKVPVGSSCYVTGWGVQHTARAYSSFLKQAILKVVSQSTCAKRNTKHTGIEVTNQMLCAGSPKKHEASCHGDSGGPLSCRAKDGRWILQGAVSWGSEYCDTKEGYSVFARVGEFVNWIKENTKEYEHH